MSKPQPMSEDARKSELFKLIKESLGERAEAVPENLKFLMAGADGAEMEQIGMEDGFVNYIYRIKERSSGSSVVVKWTRAVNRTVEEQDLELTEELAKQLADPKMLQRNTKECEALQRIGEELVPGSTPRVFWLDGDRYFFIMEDLAGYKTLRQQLIDGEVIPEVFGSISRMLATLHKRTHIKTLGEAKFKQFSDTLYKNTMLEMMADMFYKNAFKRQNDMVQTQSDAVFGDCVEKVLPQLYDNPDIVAVLPRLREKFLTAHLCYLHGDTHPGSFLINAQQEVRMLDLEASMMGFPPKEVGYTLGEVVAFYYVYQGRGEPQLAKKLRECVKTFCEDYLQRMGELIDDRAEFWRYTAAHAGHFGCFRVANLFLPFPPLQGLDEAHGKCLAALIRLLKEMETITTLDKFLYVAFQQ